MATGEVMGKQRNPRHSLRQAMQSPRKTRNTKPENPPSVKKKKKAAKAANAAKTCAMGRSRAIRAQAATNGRRPARLRGTQRPVRA